MNDDYKDDLLAQLKHQLSSATAPPFLFVGSGFSQRYLGLPSWNGLLERFCENIKPYKYYLSSANGNLPQVASLMSDDFFEHAWSDPMMSSILANKEIHSKEGVLKYFISEFISQEYDNGTFESPHPDEIQKLEGLSVDAIITTNWDCYLEDIFPEYSTYVGQDEIVVANPYGVGEIYKIHGCIKNPDSLVLTNNDYAEFESNYAYLAAKLVTFLIEHPVVFIGYSLQDENILNIIESLARCLGDGVQERLRNNLILVQRCGKGRNEGIEATRVKVHDHHVPLTTVTTDDFGIVYDAINSIKRKVPAKILRFLKEEIYEIAKSSEPEKRIFVSDFDDIEDNKNIEFVVGVGVKELHDKGIEAQATQKGYNLIEIDEILEDILTSPDDSSKFDDTGELVKGAICFHLKRSPYTPIFKYLCMLGITNEEQYRASDFELDKAYDRAFEEFHYQTQAYSKAAEGLSLSDIVQKYSPQKAAMVIPHLKPDEIDLEELKAFLKTYEEWRSKESSYRSLYRKLVTIYDRLKFGWID
ncbi:SIR2 family protein [Maridesulfovibrio bastinii]|uniref:SIR2 family protein n=1 Tax=Maridesulfovibrio bastinii TaxID=47157 RepID=UPI0004295FE6|nr:SIR2 family protein [Maridesulfovibrio bastinii]